MAYEKTNWTSTTPINTTNLNKIESGIEQNSINTEQNSIAIEQIGDLTTLDTTEKETLVNAINEANNKHNYSTEEQIVGTWINGKPIYRKVVQVTKESNANVDIYLGDDVEELIKTTGNLLSNGGIHYGDLFRYENQYNYTKVIYYPEYNKAMFISGTDQNCNGVAKIVFEYTKTTD